MKYWVTMVIDVAYKIFTSLPQTTKMCDIVLSHLE